MINKTKKSLFSSFAFKNRAGAKREPDYPPGYLAAKRVVEAGRSAFFGVQSFDLPARASTILAEDDLLPQFGYVGADYRHLRVLLLGINPSNGPENARVRNLADEKVMPALQRFAQVRSPAAFLEAQNAFKEACRSWPTWGRHCAELLTQAGLSIEQVAYANCLPWRTASQANFDESIARRAARLYAIPLVEELKPNIIVTVGRRAAAILGHAETAMPPTVVWNHARLVTELVESERRAAADRLRALLGSIRSDKAT